MRFEPINFREISFYTFEYRNFSSLKYAIKKNVCFLNDVKVTIYEPGEIDKIFRNENTFRTVRMHLQREEVEYQFIKFNWFIKILSSNK